MKWLNEMIEPITGLLSEIIPDKDKARELAFKIKDIAYERAHAIDMSQIDANKQAAKHPSMFVAGARPAALWLCIITLAMPVVHAVLNWLIAIVVAIPIAIMGLFGAEAAIPQLPPLEIPMEFYAIMGGKLLGLGGMRSWEKSKGTARSNMEHP